MSANGLHEDRLLDASPGDFFTDATRPTGMSAG